MIKKMLLDKLWNDKRFDKQNRCYFYFYRILSENDIRQTLNELERT